MAAKGSSRAHCCCTGCENLPSVVTRTDGLVNVPINPGLPLPHLTFAGHPVDLLQAVCCSCMPKTVCVAIGEIIGGEAATESSTITAMRCDLNGDTGQAPEVLMYAASLPFRGETYALEFWMRVIDGKCYFCLVSDDLGVANECQEITAEKRANRLAPWERHSSFCNKLNSDTSDNPYIPPGYLGTRWDVVVPYVGDLRITILGQEATPITGRQPCIDDYGNIVPDEDLIRNLCDGCGCLCTRACVIIHRIGTNEIFSYVLNLVDGTYIEIDPITGEEAVYGPQIAVVRDPDSDTGRACALKVLSVGEFGFTGESPLVSVQSGPHGAPGSCPNPTATWELADSEDGWPILVHFSCYECGNACGTIPAGCCAGYPIPRILHCTISKGNDAESAFCECLPITIPMVNTSGQPFWNGKFRNVPIEGNWCVGAPSDFQVQLECGSEWTLRFGNSLYHASPCADVIFGQDYGEMSCSPIMLTFTYVSGCCGAVYPYPGPSSIVLTITE